MKVFPLRGPLGNRFHELAKAFADFRKRLASFRARLPALAPAEKIAFAFIALVLTSGATLRAWERSGVSIGPVEDWETLRAMVMRSRDEFAKQGGGTHGGGYPCAVEDRPERFAARREGAAGEILAAGAAGAKPGKPSAESGGKKPPPKKPLDLNAAGEKALLALPGVGPSTAKAIVAHREAHGRFRNVDELVQVKGIGPKKLEALRPHLRVSPPADSAVSP